MNRLGFLIDDKLKGYLKEIYSMKHIIVKGMFSHLCVSDIDDFSLLNYKLKNLRKLRKFLKKKI